MGTLALPQGISGLKLAVTPKITRRIGSGQGVLHILCRLLELHVTVGVH